MRGHEDIHEDIADRHRAGVARRPRMARMARIATGRTGRGESRTRRRFMA